MCEYLGLCYLTLLIQRLEILYNEKVVQREKNLKDNPVEGAHEKLKWLLVYLFLTPPVFSSCLDQGSGPSFLLFWYILHRLHLFLMLNCLHGERRCPWPKILLILNFLDI